MKSLGRLFRRSKKGSQPQASSTPRKRRLQSEALERRELLAGDLLFHNHFAPADVDHDYRIRPRDALTVINHLNRFGMGAIEDVMPGRVGGVDGAAFVDVNGDNRLDPSDALKVINALSRGQGLDNELFELRLDVRDNQTDESLLEPGSRTLNIAPNQIVDLEISYNDLRVPVFGEGGDLGAFAVFVDLFTPNTDVSFADIVEPIVTETQDVIFSPEFRQAESGDIQFSLEDSDNVISVPLSDFVTGNLANNLKQVYLDLGLSDSQVEVTQFPADTSLPLAQRPVELRARFIGNDLANQQLPNLTIDLSGLNGAPGATANVLEIAAINPDQTVNSAAIPLNIDSHSRTFNPDLSTPPGGRVYNLFSAGSFGEDGYDDVGGLSQPFVGGIPNYTDEGNEVPFDAFSLPVRFREEISGFVIQVDQPIESPPDVDDAEILLHPGDDEDRLVAEDVFIDVDDDPSIEGDDRFGLVVINVSTGLVAETGSITLNEDLDPAGGNTIDLVSLVSDINDTGNPIEITNFSDGDHGTVELDGSTATYTPDPDYFGPDSFSFTAGNGVATVNGMVTVTVTSQNDPPVAVDDEVTVTRGSATTIPAAELLSNDNAGPSNEDQSLTIVGVTGNATLLGDGSISYTPPAGSATSDTFTYTVRDSDGAEATATVNVTINDQPVAPTASDFTLSGTEGQTLDFNDSDLLANVSGTAPITITAVSSASAGDLVDNGDGTFSYTPVNDDVFGDVATFTFTAENSLGSDSATATINLAAVNDPPNVEDDSDTVVELGAPITVMVLENDDPGNLETNDSLTITGVDVGSIAGDVTIASDGQSLQYDPQLAEPGTEVFTYTVTDEGGLTAQATVTITVTEGQRPLAVTDTIEIEEGTVGQLDVLVNDRVRSGEQAVLVEIGAVTEGDATVTRNDNGTPGDQTDDLITLTPSPGFNGPVVFTYRIEDTAGAALNEQLATAAVTVNVGPVNDPPILGADPAETVTANNTLEISVADLLANDSPGINEEDQTLTMTSVTATTSAGGSATLNGDTITYTPPMNFAGTDTITYTVSDDGDPIESSEGTLTVNVTNIRPTVGTDNVVAFLNFSATYRPDQLLANDSAGEADQSLEIVSVSPTDSTRGSVSLQEDGSIRFEPETDFIGSTSFQYTVSDGIEETTGTVNVDVQEFQPSSISGSVFFDNIESVSNPVRDGMQTDGEDGLANVMVMLYSAAEDNATQAEVSQVRYTELDGSYLFGNLAPGRYEVTVQLPTHAIDGIDVPGTLGDLDEIENQFTVNIAQPGDQQASGYFFSLIGMQGIAADYADLFSLTYLQRNQNIAEISENGLQGGIAAIDPSSGSMQHLRIGAGWDGVRHAEVVLNRDQDAALMTILDEAGNARYAVLGQDNFLVLQEDQDGDGTPEQLAVRFFGGMEDFDFMSTTEDIVASEYSGFQDAIDAILASGAFDQD